MSPSETAIGALFDEERQAIVLIKRRDVPLWVLPGGGVDPYESPEEAILREIWEETGLRVVIKRKIAEYTPLNRLAKRTHFFECQPKDGLMRLSCESTSINFWPLSHLPDNLFSVHHEWIEDAKHPSSALLKKPINSVTYWKLFSYFARHPLHVLRFAATQLRLSP